MDNMAELYIVLAVYLFVIGAFVLLSFAGAIVRSFLFVRAGEAVWKSFIPFYGSFTYHKIAFGEKNKWFWFLNLAIPGFYSVYTAIKFARSFGRTSGFSVLTIFFPFITSLMMVIQGSKYVGAQSHVFED